MKRLLVLRPEPGAAATLERARQLGFDAASLPLFRIEPLEWARPDAAEFDALLLTSANAVRHAGPNLRTVCGLPVYAVGEATAAVARQAGFRIAGTGSEGVDKLVGTIDPELRLLHLCGRDRQLPTAGHPNITAVPVYRAMENEVEFRFLEGSVALVHSPRAGARLASLIDHCRRGGIEIAAISAAALASCGNGWAGASAAESPTDEALLALAARLCNKTAAQ